MTAGRMAIRQEKLRPINGRNFGQLSDKQLTGRWPIDKTFNGLITDEITANYRTMTEEWPLDKRNYGQLIDRNYTYKSWKYGQWTREIRPINRTKVVPM